MWFINKWENVIIAIVSIGIVASNLLATENCVLELLKKTYRLVYFLRNINLSNSCHLTPMLLIHLTWQ